MHSSAAPSQRQCVAMARGGSNPASTAGTGSTGMGNQSTQPPAWPMAAQRDKDNPYTDLQPAATEDFLREHGYATFIHGHTHLPQTHDHMVDGIHVERWVLSDWHNERGESLCWDGEQLQRIALS